MIETLTCDMLRLYPSICPSNTVFHPRLFWLLQGTYWIVGASFFK